MPRQRFKRSAIASSRGSYVRKSHYLLIKESLEERNIDASIEEIIEVSIVTKAKVKTVKYAVRYFGKLIIISKEEAEKLDPKVVVEL